MTLNKYRKQCGEAIVKVCQDTEPSSITYQDLQPGRWFKFNNHLYLKTYLIIENHGRGYGAVDVCGVTQDFKPEDIVCEIEGVIEILVKE